MAGNMADSQYEYRFDPDKPNDTAASVFRMAREGGSRVLDLGSGPGIVSGALARLADKEVTCVDVESDHLESAAARGVSRTIQGDLTGSAWMEQLIGQRFDAIILADVLEHLVDPGALLARVHEQQLLDAGGHLVISIPNAAHISIVAALAAGDFPYRRTGLLDETHLRFFTLTSIRRLLEEQGYAIVRVARTTRSLGKTELSDVSASLPSETVRALQHHEEHDVYQYVIRARAMVDRTETVAASELEGLRRRLREVEGRRRRTKGRLRDAEQREDRLRQELIELKRSATWRVGRMLVGGPSAALRAGRRILR
jgi:2-polyprenyl-3-methyl-5-hydroxy-6-metoxy-1,4-benzoquinol methylase